MFLTAKVPNLGTPTAPAKANTLEGTPSTLAGVRQHAIVGCRVGTPIYSPKKRNHQQRSEH